MSNQDRKRAEQAEYRAKLMEAELNAVKSSKAYKLSKKIGIIKNQIKDDPIGLTKKVAKKILEDPKKLRHLLRSADRNATMAQVIVDQTAKYQEWILLSEPDEDDLDDQRVAADKLSYRPLISIVTPVFNPPADVFEELIESVLDQTYTNFELCLGNFGDDEETKKIIERYASIDDRVKAYYFTENLGIAGNSNQILEKVEGEYIALLDHDDTLSPDALYENAKLLNEKKYDFIYSDKDKIDEKGNRFDPLFKPYLSPEMLLNVNYLTHLNVMNTEIVRHIGGWDPATDGAQDWDLFLRVLSESKHVGFIPKVLYHWRVIATSTAMSIETKPYALANQCKAIDKYLIKNKINGHAFVKSTELFINWDRNSSHEEPLIFIYHSNFANTQRVMRWIRKVVPRPRFIIMVQGNGVNKQIEERAHKIDAETLAYSDMAHLGGTVQAHIRALPNAKNGVAVLVMDTIRFPKTNDWYESLTGWLNVPDVTVASGRLVNKNDLIVSSGGIINANNEYFPIFHNYPRYYQSYIGNAEWVRNLSVISPIFCAIKTDAILDYDFKGKAKQPATFDDFFLWLTTQKKKRVVMTPHATAMVHGEVTQESVRKINTLENKKGFLDPFGNPNMSAEDPVRLFEREALIGINETGVINPLDAYQHDATILADTFDITLEELRHNSLVTSNHKPLKPKSVAWFLPSFDGLYAGLMNIFSFANYLSAQKKLATTIYVLKSGRDVSQEKALVTAVFPELAKASFVAISPASTDSITSHDIGIATQWASAFPLAKANNIQRKCYFIQDNEANFYPKGSISALVEQSYRFGFMAIAGTDGLLDMYRSQYGGYGTVLGSKVDLSDYHPRKDLHYRPAKPYKVFFYARPNMPRNAFELGIAGLKRLKQEMGDDVEIITAGAAWDVAAYGVDGLFNNLGKIAYEAVPKLYRSVDAGLMFMFSGHPGVTASELMASGCPVVVNEYEDITWHELYVHEETCLTTAPTASEVARNLKRCLEDEKLRRKIIEGGLKKTENFYSGYEAALEDAYDAIAKG